jgi:hypothetical protein
MYYLRPLEEEKSSLGKKKAALACIKTNSFYSFIENGESKRAEKGEKYLSLYEELLKDNYFVLC